VLAAQREEEPPAAQDPPRREVDPVHRLAFREPREAERRERLHAETERRTELLVELLDLKAGREDRGGAPAGPGPVRDASLVRDGKDRVWGGRIPRQRGIAGEKQALV